MICVVMKKPVVSDPLQIHGLEEPHHQQDQHQLLNEISLLQEGTRQFLTSIPWVEWELAMFISMRVERRFRFLRCLHGNFQWLCAAHAVSVTHAPRTEGIGM